MTPPRGLNETGACARLGERDEQYAAKYLHVKPEGYQLPSEQLVRAVLGQDAPNDIVDRIVAHAEGNAFFLEELVRHAAEGGKELPDTVLAMVQARLEALDAEARRVLQAASVYGETFREEGVTALLGGDSAPMDVGGWLEHLADHELIDRPAADAELTFRHALVRDAAYAMIAERDRGAAHLVAAEWLEARGDETDPRVLIEHFERAAAPERAVDAYLKAAVTAFEAGDLLGTRTFCERGRAATNATTQVGQELGLVKGYACAWLGEWARVMELADETLPHMPHGSLRWYQSAGGKVYAAVCLGQPERSMEELQQIMAVEELPDATARTGHIVAMVANTLTIAGQG
jgi:eukaryotic-like serine/threonine-protein kinase